MKILVTGGLGTLGRPLVAKLREEGHEAWTLDTTHAESHQNIRADVGCYRQIERVFQQLEPQAVYHLAAEFGRKNGEDYFEQCWRTGAVGTKNLLLMQAQHGFRLVHASSSEVYGNIDEDWIREDHALSPVSRAIPGNDYALSKWVNEAQIINHELETGLKVTRLRFFNAYGPGELFHPYRSVVALFCYAALHDQPVQVYRNYHRVFMFIDDFIRTLARAINLPDDAPSVMNVGGVDYRSVEDLWALIERYVPTTRSEVDYVEQDGHNVKNKRPDITLARQHLGHDPQIELPEGVARTLEWMRSVYPGAREKTVTYVRSEWKAGRA